MMSTEVFQMRNENERFVEMGKRIRARRLSLKMKQMELAEKVDISNNHRERNRTSGTGFIHQDL